MLDPRQTFIDVTVQLGRDITLYPGTMLHGSTRVDNGCNLGPNTRLIDCKVGQGVQIQYSVAEGVEFKSGARVGPYAALSQGTVVESNEVTGPFYTGG
jgi:bifunctional UDP-N-acetylglucosamine pyrophosphorylase/glucosamine-1-phosphate N-acetyltransferase